MKKYRLGYDYLFLASDSFSYKGDFIGSMAINVLFKVFDKMGNEVLFESDKLEDQRLYFKNGNSCYLSEFFNCFIDKNNIFNIIPDISLLKESGYKILFEIDSYYKDIDKSLDKFIMLEPTLITKEEFKDIIKNNMHLFYNSTNNPAQTTSYFTYELKENELPKILGKKYPKVEPKVRFTLEKVTKIEPIFRYNSCYPILINDNISTIEQVKNLAILIKDSLKEEEFFLVTRYENERKVDRGRLYI